MNNDTWTAVFIIEMIFLFLMGIGAIVWVWAQWDNRKPRDFKDNFDIQINKRDE